MQRDKLLVQKFEREPEGAGVHFDLYALYIGEAFDARRPLSSFALKAPGAQESVSLRLAASFCCLNEKPVLILCTT